MTEKAERVCNTCGISKGILEFNLTGDEKKYRRNDCKVCQRAKELKKKKKKPKKVYGSVIDEFLCNQTYITLLATCWSWNDERNIYISKR